MEEPQQNGSVNDVYGIWSVNKDDSTETSVEAETGTIADSLHKYFTEKKQTGEQSDEINNALQGVENIAFLRKWLVVPITIFYFGAYVTSALTLQQFVYVKLQREKFPNESFNSSIPVCNANESDPKYKLQVEVQKESAEWMTYFSLASGIPGVFADLVLGSYTDRFGRKFLFFLPCIGAFVHLVVNTVGIYTDFALYWYIPASVFDGLTGQLFGLLLVTFSYTADITKAGRQRSLGIVIIELSIGIGFTGFSFSTGYFIQATGFFWPMLFAAGCLVLTLVLVFILPETYPKEKRTPTSSPWENLTNGVALYIGKENSGKRWKYIILMLTFVLTMLTVLGRANVETLYVLNNPFCWNPEKVSWFVALRSGTQQIVGMALVKPLQMVLSDEIISVVGSLSFVAGFTIESMAKMDALLYVCKYSSVRGTFNYIICLINNYFSMKHKLSHCTKGSGMFTCE